MGALVGVVVSHTNESGVHKLDTDEARKALAALTAGWVGPIGVRGLIGGHIRKVLGGSLFAPANLNGVVQALAGYCAAGYSPYLVLNPFVSGHGGALKDVFVARRRWFFIDIDPVKPAAHKDDPATDGEKSAAVQLAFDVFDWLASLGWPPPMQIDSGNGHYLLYPVDLPADAATLALVKEAMAAIRQRFDGDSRGKIDANVVNAARLAKVPGGLAVKGEQSGERPYRRCHLLHAPGRENLLTADQLAELANAGAPPAKVVKEMQSAESALRGRVSGEADVERRAAAYLDRCPGAISGSGGHPATFWAARAMVKGFALSEAVALRLLRDHYNPRCQPPWSDRELEHKVSEAANKPFGKPDGWMLHDDPPHRLNGSTKSASAPTAANQPGGESGRWSIRQDDEEVVAGDPASILPDLAGALGDDGEQHSRIVNIYSIGSILATDYPEPNWVVPGIMSEGLNILAGAPKQGKSVLALNLALTVAGGGKALGNVRVEPADVLYLALEDKPRRIKHRAAKMLREIQPDLAGNVSARLAIATDWPRQHERGLAAVAWWVRRAERPRLVIIDVWYRFGPPQQDRGNAYAQDAEHLGQLKRFADAHGVSVLVVHHTRKASMLKEPDDYLQEVSGTMGITGAADGILVLLRNRNENRAVLNVTGRDVGDTQLVLEFDRESLTWKSLGTKDEHTHGTVKAKVIAHLKQVGPKGNNTPAIAVAIGENQASVRQVLHRMLADRQVNKSGNNYTWPGDGETESF